MKNKFIRLGQSRQGFTLIEIMVVILIIGILSSVVLAVLGDSRLKAKDAKIQSELGSFRTQAELLAVNDVYMFNCETIIDPFLVSIQDSAKDNNLDCKLSDDFKSYAVTAQLNKDPNIVYCIDSHHFIGFDGWEHDTINDIYYCTP